MKKIFSLIIVLALSLSVFAGCGNSEDAKTETTKAAETTAAKEPVELFILAAASLTDSLNEIKEKYEAENENVTLTITYESSGALQTKIEQGVDADIFISAAQKQMTALKDQSLVDENTISDLLLNEIVVIVPKDSNVKVAEAADILGIEGDYVALGDPASVPAGQYAEESLKNLGLYDSLIAKKQISYGENVKAVLSYVESGEVAFGVVYSTDAISSDNIKVVYTLPADSHTKISYPAGIVSSSDNKEDAASFLDYLQTDEIAKVFESYGFSVE